MTTTPTRGGGVRAQFLGGRPPPTFGGAFQEEEDNNEDNGDKQGQLARRKRHDAVDVRDALRGQAPEAPIAGDDRGEGGRGGSIADKTITDRARTTATKEQGMLVTTTT